MLKIYFVVILIFTTNLSFAERQEDLCTIAKEALKSAELVRELKVKKDVQCIVENKQKIENYVLKALAEQASKEKLYYEEQIFKTLGIITTDFSYVKELTNIYTSQIGGYYNPETKSFVMADWIPATLQKTVAVHELTHALQDQYFDLKKFTDNSNLTSDELLARAALIEGDASAVMLDQALREGRGGRLSEQKNSNLFIAQNVLAISAMQNAKTPKTILSLIMFPYSSGLRFAHEVIKLHGYSGLDRAFKATPVTTKEILHPEIYLNGRYKHQEISVDELKLAMEVEVLHKDRMGEFFVSVWLNSQGLDSFKSAKASSGWAGDLLALIKEKDSYELVWKINWDTVADSAEFQDALRSLADKKFHDTLKCSNKSCLLSLIN